jgi:hypothetical protein
LPTAKLGRSKAVCKMGRAAPASIARLPHANNARCSFPVDGRAY